MSGRILSAYFSLNGETLEGRDIVFREKGHAQLAAEYIHEAIGGDLFEIETAVPYPDNHMRRVMQARKEIEESVRPPLKGLPVGFEQYETVFLCFPIWWFTIPMPVATFLESFDWSGKTIIPINTSNSSGTGYSARDIRLLSKGATVKDALELRGPNVRYMKDYIQTWATQFNAAVNKLS